MLAENRRHIFLVRKTIIAIHPKLSKFLFSLLKLLFYDKISRRQHEQCSNTSDVFLALREKYGEDAALSLIYINLKFLKAEKALECFEGVSIPSVDIEQTPYDILLRDITQIVLIVGEKRVEELICYLAKVYLDDPHPDHVREWGVLGVFSQLIDGANIVPENGTDSLINSVEQVFDDRAILERCRDCVENGLTSGDEDHQPLPTVEADVTLQRTPQTDHQPLPTVEADATGQRTPQTDHQPLPTVEADATGQRTPQTDHQPLPFVEADATGQRTPQTEISDTFPSPGSQSDVPGIDERPEPLPSPGSQSDERPEPLPSPGSQSDVPGIDERPEPLPSPGSQTDVPGIDERPEPLPSPGSQSDVPGIDERPEPLPSSGSQSDVPGIDERLEAIERALFTVPRDPSRSIQSTVTLSDELVLFSQCSLGTGTFGTVYKGEYCNQPCAIKILHTMLTEIRTNIPSLPHEGQARSLQQECKFLESFRHPNILEHLCTACHPESNQVILVIELMDCNLKDYIESIKDTGMDFGDKVFICQGIASGLEYIHGRSIVHRDLCSVNILVNCTHPPIAKISDFGISKMIDNDHLTTQTRLRDRNGYLPPEAFLNDRAAYNSSLDVFSYGVIVAQIACSVPVVESAKHRDKIVAKIPKINPLKPIVQRCLKKNSSKRPSAKEVNTQLKKMLEGKNEEYSQRKSLFDRPGLKTLCGVTVAILILFSLLYGQWNTVLPETDCAASSHPVQLLKDLYKDLSMIGDWEGLCGNLGVVKSVMEELRFSHEMALSSKRSRCLEAYYDSGEAVWEKVVEALCELSSPKKKQAKSIARKYGVEYSCIAACSKHEL